MRSVNSFKILSGSIVVCLISCFLLLLPRMKSVIEDSVYSQTSGAESVALYGVYKSYSSQSLYHNIKNNRSTLLYNYGFFEMYGIFNTHFTEDSKNIPLNSRMFTLVICILLVTSASYFTFSGYIETALSTLLVISPTVGWWALTTRPDLPAACLTFAGICLSWKGWREKSTSMSVLGIILLTVSLTFKQTYILYPSVLLILFVLANRYYLAGITATIVASFSLLPFLVYGYDYYIHSVVVPSVPPLSVGYGFSVFAKALLKGYYVYIPVIFIMMYSLSRRDKLLISLSLVCILSIFIDSFLSMRVGSSTSYFFPSFTLSTFTTILFINRVHRGLYSLRSKYVNMSLSCLVISLSIVPPLYITGLIGTLEISNHRLTKNVKDASEKISQIEGNTFVGPSYISLPWLSGDDNPEVIDWVFYKYGVREGIISSIESGIQSGEYDNYILRKKNFINYLINSPKYKKCGKIWNMKWFTKVGNKCINR